MIFQEESPYHDGKFGVGDLNVCYWLPAIEAGWPVIGLPVFVKRKPVYEYIFCRTGAGIREPRDLAGRRIGARQYRVSTIIWAVGLLQEHYDVDFSDVEWVVWTNEVFPLHRPPRIAPPADPQKSVVDSLIDGEVDAIITDISDAALFERLENSPEVHRLFPSYADEDFKLYQETEIFTPAHLMVMNRDLDRAHPELSTKLFQAFEQSKQVAYNDILSDQRGFGIPYLREAFLENRRRWGDPWRNGLSANKREIDTFIRYNRELGMISSDLTYEQIFAAGTLDT
jgi:4,5-dihydroxyphthalate decarboxylase